MFNPPKVESRPMVDLLFVVDNSGSMKDDQNILAQSFGAFIKAFREKDVDARYGLITTDMTSSKATTNSRPYWEAKFPGYYSPSTGHLLNKFAQPMWLNSGDKDLVGHFNANVRVGIEGSGSEQGLQSLELALSEKHLGNGGFNQGFLRDEAMLSIVIVSDEDNDIREKGLTPEALSDRVRARLAQVKGPKSRGYSCDMVIDLNAKAPSTPVVYPLPSGLTSYPNAYLKASEKLGCRKLNIAKNWGSDLAKIGYQIVNQAEKEFKLSVKPIASSIVVKIDGVVIAADSTNGYIYHADRSTIELVGAALVKSAGAKITVDYQYYQ
jgi:hypothetical protein